MNYRLNRLFNKNSNRALDVAIDHGFFGEASFINGIENMNNAISTVVAAAPDAVQLSLGHAKILQNIAGKEKPALVLRTDVANIYGNPLAEKLFTIHIPNAIEEAVRLDATAVCVNLLQLPGRPEITGECIKSIMQLRKDATKYNMPLMIEPLVMQDNSLSGGYMVDGDTKKILALVRQAKELGADLIKADPSDNIEDYHKIIEVAGDTPVLVRGGGRVDDVTLLKRTIAVLEQGARGIVYGRNIVQHNNPKAITAALMSILHENSSLEQALAVLNER